MWDAYSAGMRPEEDWAARCIGHELRVNVVEHDDNSSPGMFDLSIAYPDRPHGAVEVTAAADEESIKLGKLVYDGKRWIVEGIIGGWVAGLHPTASMKRIRQDLPPLLQSLERQSIQNPEPEVYWEPGLHKELIRALGIAHLAQHSTDYPGCVYLTVEQDPDRTGGMSPTDGRPLLEWLADWLILPDKADNLAKLGASGADERHLFLILPSFADAPFGVVDLLMRDDSPLPDGQPELLPEVTHLWMVSTWNFSSTGIRWSPDGGWSRFAKAG
jgi:hypothetical protein